MRRFFGVLGICFLFLTLITPSVFSDSTPTPTATPTLTPTPTATPTETPTSTPTPTSSPAPDTSALAAKILDIERQQAQIQDELDKLASQKKTLTATISILDNKIKLTNLNIQKATQELAKLEEEIQQLSETLDKLKSDLAKVEQVLTDRIRATYKKGNLSAVELMFSSGSFSDFVNRLRYLQIIQQNDRRILYQTQSAKAVFTDQKEEKQKKEAEVAKLKASIEAENSGLKTQKAEKDRLLAVTRNDEKRFQGMLAQLQEDLDSINRAIGNVGIKIGPVSKGERIAAVGNTGCSTGPHLHFEVWVNAKVEDGRIIGSRVDPKPYLDSGRLGKPLDSYNGQDYPAGNITTRYGAYGNNYIPGFPPHTGLDMADNLGTPIHAADSGVAYFLSDPRACYLTGTIGRGIVVDHQNGIVTLYWHIL